MKNSQRYQLLEKYINFHTPSFTKIGINKYRYCSDRLCGECDIYDHCTDLVGDGTITSKEYEYFKSRNPEYFI